MRCITQFTLNFLYDTLFRITNNKSMLYNSLDDNARKNIFS